MMNTLKMFNNNSYYNKTVNSNEQHQRRRYKCKCRAIKTKCKRHDTIRKEIMYTPKYQTTTEGDYLIPLNPGYFKTDKNLYIYLNLFTNNKHQTKQLI